MDLNSNNSSTSLSGNSNLKDHYENLLFKNNDDEFFSDSPKTLQESKRNINSNNLINKAYFMQNSSPFPNKSNNYLLADNFNHFTNNLNTNNANIWRHNHTVNTQDHGKKYHNNNTPQNPQFSNTQPNTLFDTYPQTNYTSVHNHNNYLSNFPQSASNTTNYTNFNNSNSIQSQNYMHQWPIFNNYGTSSRLSIDFKPKSNGYINNYNTTTNSINPTNSFNKDNKLGNLNSLEKGILLTDSNIMSSSELHKLSQTYGMDYFSTEQVYQFVDHLNNLIQYKENETNNKQINSLIHFLNFLLSRNKEYETLFSKKDSNDTDDKVKNQFSNPNKIDKLILISGKNGKLDILSGPINSKLSLKRGDIVIIDGDRGKDIAQIIVPDLNFKLALIINFLKKKIHFDSLITSKSQHIPNFQFIESLINFKNEFNTQINPELYDVVELTHFVIPSKQIIRFAKPSEISVALPAKFKDEAEALLLAQKKLESLNKNMMINTVKTTKNQITTGNFEPLNIKLLNAEFQFDRRKLTFYYVCEVRNDFRNLVKDLFKFYKTRIWLCAIPNNLNIEKSFTTVNYVNDDLQVGKDNIISPMDNTQDNTNNNIQVKEINPNNFQIYIFKNMFEELFHLS